MLVEVTEEGRVCFVHSVSSAPDSEVVFTVVIVQTKRIRKLQLYLVICTVLADNIKNYGCFILQVFLLPFLLYVMFTLDFYNR